MPWIQIQLSTTEQQQEQFEDLLLAAGAVSVTLQNNGDAPILEPLPGETPLWGKLRVIGLFEADIDVNQVTNFLKEQVAVDPLPGLKIEALEDKDWHRAWMDEYHPVHCGGELWICPSWLDAPHPEAVNVRLDPGMAFGTGTHPTTFLCLKWLADHPPQDLQVIDFGCGSGILAVAAALLGANVVDCIDIDPQALLATRDNAEKNSLSEQQIRSWLPEHAPDSVADLLIANILAGPLIELSSEMAARVKPGGKLVLSGILEHQVPAMLDCYSQWFEMSEPEIHHEGWARLDGIRKGNR
ncbi:50S ribosomal protein L11 methyltransferase [Pelagibaculum spongiae]|uniref:Ribosomal protein L11 methyltransferase n=1 Tax=Pelagibaculum spongiae TaxID=2080658 RepID=A0A2V1GR71_9GAMM|nr:50S ribosomal protein L11 methyltransferase [Pelagibaculum spongiae]PVZ66273.1 50S ribosomal protein L11 methyltransferase [Pelagibaculum spongiae]